MNVKFGPSGNSDLFYEDGNKSSLQMPEWLHKMGLSAYEYQCTKGVNINLEESKKLGQEAKKYGITLSVHSPYYISLSSIEDDKIKKSLKYIIDTLAVANAMGAKRIVVHSGSNLKMTKSKAFLIAKSSLLNAINEAKSLGYGHIHICPETMGRVNYFGTIEEVVELCKLDDYLLPTVDFGHIHTRGLGALKEYSDYLRIFDVIENGLGIDRLKNIHIHYSRIEYTEVGEKKHWTYSDTQYGPEFEPIAEIIYKKNLCPIIICESRRTMAEDALTLKKIYLNIMRNDI